MSARLTDCPGNMCSYIQIHSFFAFVMFEPHTYMHAQIRALSGRRINHTARPVQLIFVKGSAHSYLKNILLSFVEKALPAIVVRLLACRILNTYSLYQFLRYTSKITIFPCNVLWF
jgi:hypothetical protein